MYNDIMKIIPTWARSIPSRFTKQLFRIAGAILKRCLMNPR